MNVDFSGSDLTKASLLRARLVGANLTNCAMHGARFFETDLRNAILDGTQLIGARFVEARVFNVKKDRIGSLDRLRIHSIYTNPEGDGGELTGDEALRFFQAETGC
jgi:hypothetical protein